MKEFNNMYLKIFRFIISIFIVLIFTSCEKKISTNPKEIHWDSRGEAGSVGRVDVAGARSVLLNGFSACLDRNRLVADVVRAEEVRKVQLGGGAGLDTDGRTIKVLGRRNAERSWNHEALAVIVVRAGKFELQVDVAREGPGGVAGQHIDLARGESGEAGLAGGRHKLYGHRVAENSGGHGAAHINVKALPDAVGVRGSKTGQAGRDATVQLTARKNIVECRSRSRSGSETCDGQRSQKNSFFHFYLFLSCRTLPGAVSFQQGQGRPSYTMRRDFSPQRTKTGRNPTGGQVLWRQNWLRIQGHSDRKAELIGQFSRQWEKASISRIRAALRKAHSFAKAAAAASSSWPHCSI